nr:MAG TPA: hypothetical protein [Caudoviricetes sp.]
MVYLCIEITLNIMYYIAIRNRKQAPRKGDRKHEKNQN